MAVPATRAPAGSAGKAAFTLIEMSIVLVIIGLIVGGVLVGQDLIRAAGVRATVSQIEKYNTAVNTFRDKYGGLPGDLNASLASQFGFTPRAGTTGWGDGNGVIGSDGGNPAWAGFASSYAELCLFWVDLTSANGQNVNLIDGSFTGFTPGAMAGPCTLNWGAVSTDTYFPQAKLGAGNYIYVWSGGITSMWGSPASDGVNYFGISAVTGIGGNIWSNPGLTVQQGYSIDKKIDDGLPQTGNVIAAYISDWTWWAVGGGGGGPVAGQVASQSAISCYDNGGNASNPMQYSLAQNGGAGVNCALSFRFQ